MSRNMNYGKRPRNEEEGRRTWYIFVQALSLMLLYVECLTDIGSQQSILKWMRQVPGPLQDVMKKRAHELDESQGSFRRIVNEKSDRFSVAITTVFDQGPWVKMCQYLGMPAVSGSLYGSIKISALKNTVQGIAEDDEALAKVPLLLVLIKSVRCIEDEIVAVLHVLEFLFKVRGGFSNRDPTGEIEGYFHRELVERLGPALIAGVGILLYKVSVFTPTEAPVGGLRKSYLNITPRNVRRVFVAENSIKVETVDDPVKLFNEKKEVEYEQESDNDDYDNNNASRSEQAACQILQHSSIRDTSAELTFLSQRQVIHRNPPVRADSSVAMANSNKNSKRDKGATASKSQDHESGVGKWQWSKLLKKTNDASIDESGTDSRRTQERQGLLDASTRLVDLITKRNAANRASSPPDGGSKEDAASMTKIKSASVHFASGTMVYPPVTGCNSDSHMIESTDSCLPSQPARADQKLESKKSDTEEDDGW
ncbi:hypothetical protein PsorP6_004989 [Peronosclerospora sorghi]|uniref:Uncharacterized protein n=1 Tax=Peronosclerospora sorghi TaxID=230839 RepID=A0ACC0W7U7_9STRA|nr:hypothetical protein PsorP6_004989 [Peronosclerospora sorghi]